MVAQSVERVRSNSNVVGSIPAASKFFFFIYFLVFNDLVNFYCFFSLENNLNFFLSKIEILIEIDH